MGSSSSADRLSGISQPQRRSNVTLMDNDIASGSFASSVILGSRVRIGAARRSGLLSAISDTEGVADLPEGVSVEDVRLWQTASVVSCEPSVDELGRILQVADVLGDSAADTWIHRLAQRALALPKPWKSQAAGPDTLCALLRLPAHLRTCVFSVCLATHSHTLPKLLDVFPFAFHASLIACAVSINSGALKVPSSPHDSFYPLLAAASAMMPAPGLVSLTVAESISMSDAGLLASALAHHSTLTRLTLGCCLNPAHRECIRALGACVPPASLPRLQVLVLSMDASPWLGCGGAAALSVALRSFTAITALGIRLSTVHSHAAGSTVSDYISVATSPAALTHLKTLAVEEFDVTTGAGSGKRRADMYSGMHLLLPLIAAPALTRLSFSTNMGLISWTELLRSLQQCSSLQVLDLDADLREGDARPKSMLPALAASHASPPPLPSLHTLEVTSICPVASLHMVALVANQAAASLSQITLRHKHAFTQRSAVRSMPTSSQEMIAQAWDDVIAAVGRCHGLQCLRMWIPSSEHSSVNGPDRSEALAGALGHLPLLTELRFDGICRQCQPGASGTVPGQAFGRSLRALLRLQRIHICGSGTCSVTEPDKVLGALPALRSLTYLGLCCSGIDQAAVGGVIPKLRALKELQLDAALFVSNAEATEDVFAARFPKVKIWACTAGQ